MSKQVLSAAGIIISLLFCADISAGETVFKCTNEKGEITFSDEPCEGTMEIVPEAVLLGTNKLKTPPPEAQETKPEVKTAPETVSKPSTVSKSSVDSGAYELNYDDETEIHNLRVSLETTQNKQLSGFYRAEIDRVKQGLFNALNHDERTERQNHLRTLNRATASSQEIQEAIAAIASLYQKYR